MGILIVDDSEDIRLLLENILTGAGYGDVLSLASPEDAIAFLESEKNSNTIDLILMDIVMPGMDGIEACRKIKSDKELSHIPIIMVTSLDEEKLLDLAFKSGAVDYVTKPIKKVELLARTANILKLQHKIDEHSEKEKSLLSAARQLHDISCLDDLTGIYNRRALDERLKYEFRRAKYSGMGMACIMIDVDFFKKFNDSKGHQAGDECLKALAEKLKETLHRPGDFLARYGGEEFCILLPDTGDGGALKIAEKLLSAVEVMKIPHPDSDIGEFLTISLGVASVAPGEDMLPNSLLDAADKALSEAKIEGRNMVKVSGDSC